MKLTVIIPSYKRPDFLEKCIDSFSNQVRKADEIIVVIRPDDIESERIVNSYSTILKKVYVYTPGFILALNAGIENSTGDIICFIDDDAIPETHWLEKIENQFQDKTIGAVGGPVIRMVNNQPIIRYTNVWHKIYWFGLNISHSESIPYNAQDVPNLRGCNMSYRKDLMNPFDTNLMGYWRNEEDQCMAIIDKGFRVVCHPEIQVYHFIGPIQVEFQRSAINKVSTIGAEHNHIYVLLKHRRFVNRFFFLLFTFFCGDIHNPGLLILLFHFFKRPRLGVITKLLPWTLIGKWQGIQTYLRYQKAEKDLQSLQRE